MRKQFVQSMKKILYSDSNTCLLLGDIWVFGFREELKSISDRVYNIGILEQSTVSLASGLAKSGLIPFVHTIAPFMVERAFEQIKIDFGYQKYNGNFISVGSSYDYSSLGCTHHCPADIGILSYIPEVNLYIPGSSKEFDHLLNKTYNFGINYYRLSEYENSESYLQPIGKGILIKKGKKATVICFGNMLDSVLSACKNLDVTILYYNTLRPFDHVLLRDNFNQNIIICEPFYEGTANYFITKALEENCCGIFEHYYRILNIAIPRTFLYNYGTKNNQDEFIKIDEKSIYERITKWLK